MKAIVRHLWLKKDIKQSIDTRRIDHQLSPMQVSYEPNVDQVWLILHLKKINCDNIQKVLKGLQERGHKIEKMDRFGSVVNGIERGDDGRVYANADFRKAGGVDGFWTNYRIKIWRKDMNTFLGCELPSPGYFYKFKSF